MPCCCSGDCKCGASGGSALGSTLSLNISGVTIPSTCLGMDGEWFCTPFVNSSVLGGLAFQFINVPINGTFCLTKDSTPNTCWWNTIVPCTVYSWWPSDFRQNLCGRDGGCHGYSAPICDLHTSVQLKIQVSMLFEPGVGAKVKLQAWILDGPPIYELVPFWYISHDGYNPFLIIDTDYHVLDCHGSVTFSDNKQVWWTYWANVWTTDTGVFGETGPCHLVEQRDPAGPGTQYGGTFIVSDSPC